MRMDAAREILESHGAKKVERPDLEVRCDVYEFDRREVAGPTLRRELEAAGFEYLNSGGDDYFNRIAGNGKLVTPTSELRGVVSREDGSFGYDETQEADARVMEAMVGGVVAFQSPAEIERVVSRLRPGLAICPLGPKMINRMTRERNCLLSGEAIMVSPLDAPGLYYMVAERQQ
jgi:hypothetical protein